MRLIPGNLGFSPEYEKIGTLRRDAIWHHKNDL